MIGKFTVTLVLLFLAACASFSNAQAHKEVIFEDAKDGSWYLNATGSAEANVTAADVIKVTIPFNASSRPIIAYMMDENCTNPFLPSGEGVALSFDRLRNSDDNAFTQYDMSMGLNITTIRKYGLGKWNDDNTTGTFQYCLRQEMYLYSKDEETGDFIKDMNLMFNFLENKVNVTVNLDASFSVTSVNAERKDATQEKLNLDYSDYVTAYECVESDLVNKANNQEYSQGDELKICVKSKDPTIVQVGGIQRLTLSQDDDATDDDFTYINGGNPVSSEIAATTCNTDLSPAHVCHADMQLLGRYFEDESPGELTATGSVKLSFPDGSTSRRLTVDVPIASGIRGGDLALEKSARRMEEEKPDDSPFDLTVTLKSLVESGSDYYGVSLVSGLVAAAGGAILMV